MLRQPGLHSWIRHLSDPVRDAVLGYMRPRAMAAGDTVYALGDSPDYCYLIKRGRVRICNFSQSGKEIIMGELRAGDCLGEISFIDGLPRFDMAVAAEAGELLVLARSDFDRLYAEYDEIARSLNKQLAYRVRLLYLQLDEANALSLGQRLARQLSRIAFASGIEQESGEVLVQPLSHEGLASMLGATRQAVSQEMKRLERAGVLRISYGRVYIMDMPALLGPVESLIGGEAVVPTYDGVD